MDKSTPLTDALKSSVSAAFHALSGHNSAVSLHQESEAPFTAAERVTEKMVTLPLPVQLHRDALRYLRGTGDAAALWARHHDRKLHHTQRPSGDAGDLLDALEQVRVEALTDAAHDGVAANLQSRYQQWLRARHLHVPTGAKMATTSDVLTILVRDGLLPSGKGPFNDAVHERFGKAYSKSLRKLLPHLQASLHDQKQYAEQILSLIKQLGGDLREPLHDEQDSSPEGLESKRQTEKTDDDSTMLEPGMDAKSVTAEAPQDQDSDNTTQQKELASDQMPDSASGRRSDFSNVVPLQPQRYAHFTSQFDEIVHARDLASNEDLHALRAQLDQRLSLIRDVTRRLAIRLQRMLQSQAVRSWKLHAEEGILDSAKLSRIIIDPTYPYPYKYEKETHELNTVVSLLIDNSGSMRGRPITVAALSADILTRTLERCGIKVEVLGFTTREWKGGASRKLWLDKGAPELPGRLNDLRHIVYKEATTPWRSAKLSLGLMLKDGILKENIDGEALLWAHDRLMARPEARKILMVISDGAPVDDSTLSSNSAHYLDRHLKDVIHSIEAYSPVELLAIGIGHDVTTYYSNAVTLRDAEQLGDTMIGKLMELFGKK